MKKLISGITMAAMITLMSTAVLAAESPTEGPTSGTTREMKFNSEKKALRSEFKLKVAPLKDEARANREGNAALREQNRALSLQIKDKLTALKESESKLTEEQKSNLKSLRETVKLYRTDIGDTKGQIKLILEANKENLKNMDFTAVEAAFNEVYEIQILRHDKLQLINSALDEILLTLN